MSYHLSLPILKMQICNYYNQNPPMDENFTLLLLSQHYPFSQQLQVFSYDDVSIDADIADFLHTAEQQVSQRVINNINIHASAAVQH